MYEGSSSVYKPDKQDIQKYPQILIPYQYRKM